MATTTDFKNGVTLRYKGELYTLVEFQHVSPGNWRAFVRAKLKNLRTGRVVEDRFRAGEEVDIVWLTRQEWQYLYKDGDDFVLMNTETFDQMPVSSEVMGEAARFLKEESTVQVLFDEEKIVGVELANFAELTVTYTEQGVRGDTATNVLKAATLETGAVVQVPLFVNQGDKVKVDTRTGQYLERVK